MELLVRYEDPTVLAVDKPAGMHTAPLRRGEEGTLLGEVIRRYPEVASLPGIKAVEPGLLHRLDRDTSGLLLIARSAESFDRLRASFDAGLVEKGYAAVCRAGSPPVAGCSHLPGSRIRIASRFAPYGPGRRRVRVVEPEIALLGEGGVVEDGGSRGRGARRRRPAETTARTYTTEVEVVAREATLFLVHARISSGFRHQVRAHLAALGLPILGDDLYGEAACGTAAAGHPTTTIGEHPQEPLVGRLHLHAASLRLPHPSGGAPLVIRSPLPPEFRRLFPGAE